MKFRKFLEEGRKVTDPIALAVKKHAEDHFGKVYSSARIGKGTTHRVSIPVKTPVNAYHYGRAIPHGSDMSHDRYGPGKQGMHPDDKKHLEDKAKSFKDRLQKHGIDPDKVDVKYHVGAGVYASVRTKLHTPKTHLKLTTSGEKKIVK